MYTPNQIMGTPQTSAYHPIMRALVTYSNPLTGEIKVKIPAVTGVVSELSISYIGRTDYNNYWIVPEIGSQIVVSADDPNMTNLFWVQTEPFNPKTNEPTGFVNRNDSTLSFSDATRTLTLSPVGESYEVYVRGNLFTIDSSVSVTIPNVTGVYFFYVDSTGTLKYSTTPFDIEWTAPVAYLYWRSFSTTAILLADERHGTTMDWATHEYLHRTRGAAYATGFGISNYTTNGTGSTSAGLIFDIANGTFYDEDLEINITHSATPVANTFQQRLQNGAYLPVFYRDTNGWNKDTATQFALKFATTGGNYPFYNSGTSLVQMDNNRYGVIWVVATNSLNEPIISLMGQAEYANIHDAELVEWGSLSIPEIPLFEFRPLWKIVFQTQNNTFKAAIREVIDIRVSIVNIDSTAPSAPEMPTGALVPFAGSVPPSGWLSCDGTAVSRATYSSLFAVIGTTYGSGNGSTTFNLPDLRGRTPIGVGQGTGLTNRALASTGGAETHTLNSTQIPAHTHTYRPAYALGNGTAALDGTAIQGNSSEWFRSTYNAIAQQTTDSNTGGGGAHNNMQPFISLNYIIKT